MNLICSICLAPLIVKSDRVHTTVCGHLFHLGCLQQSLKTSSQCPSCRKANVSHFQLFFDTEDDFQGAKCLEFNKDNDVNSTNFMFKAIIEKLDNMSLKMQSRDTKNSSPVLFASSSTTNRSDNEICNDLLSKIDKLSKENEDLKEIHEMQEVVLGNTEKEIKTLKEEIRQRNDIINLLQLQNDNLRTEMREFRLINAVRRDNLIDL